MDIGHATKQALLDRRKNSQWLAEKLGADVDENGRLKTGMACYHMRTAKQSSKSIETLAGIFEMSVSDFIKLGEWDEQNDG